MTERAEKVSIDRAVAGVLGLVCTHRVLGSGIEFYADPRDPLPGVRAFLPSTNLDDAFRAAEAVGLFNNYRVLRKNRLHWEVMEIGDPLDRVVSSGETAALAICAAILKGEALN